MNSPLNIPYLGGCFVVFSFFQVHCMIPQTVLVLAWSLAGLGFNAEKHHGFYAENIDGPAYVCYKLAGGNWDTLGFVPGPHLGYFYDFPEGFSGADSIKYIFPDPIAWARARQDLDGLPYPADNDPLRLSPHLRKPGMEFGWDFARRDIKTGAEPPFFQRKHHDWILEWCHSSHLWKPRRAGGPPPKHLPSSGARSVELVTDEPTQPFYLKVNGKKVFMLGVNAVVPHGYAAQERLRKRLIEMWKAGGNTVRFWGGAYYPSDRILNTCDSLGIMVWQDFSYAGTAYPGDSLFRYWAKEEAVYQVKRMAMHPSVVVFCGNNEITMAWENWGWQQTYSMSPEDSAQLADNNHWLFNDMLPSVVEEYGDAVYVSSSPTSNWGKPEDFTRGSNHDWRVWHGEQPTSVLAETVAPFVAEWGVPSLPGKSVRARWTSGPEDYVLSYKGLALLERYLEAEMGYVHHGNVELLAQKSREWQAQVVYSTITAQGESRPFCSGSLVWQLNDIDDVITWSLIDADDVPKPAWEAAKKAWREFK